MFSFLFSLSCTVLGTVTVHGCQCALYRWSVEWCWDKGKASKGRWSVRTELDLRVSTCSSTYWLLLVRSQRVPLVPLESGLCLPLLHFYDLLSRDLGGRRRFQGGI